MSTKENIEIFNFDEGYKAEDFAMEINFNSEIFSADIPNERHSGQIEKQKKFSKSLVLIEKHEIASKFLPPAYLTHFLNEVGGIKSRHATNLSAKCQRRISRAIRRARFLGTLPFQVTASY